MVLNEKERQIGKVNYADALKVSRRQVLTGAIALPTAAAMYWGYDHLKGGPVKVGLIGTGNQGCNAHISQSNPDFIDIVAFSDIRPSNQARARKLFNEKYGARGKNVELYEDYHKLLERDDIEMVIVALPLHLHAKVTIEALQAGKHVLCEKLMAKTVSQCKEMIRAAKQTNRFLAVGHQRHYSYMYANALSIIKQGILGDIRHIRACWHRNQSKHDSWRPGIPAADQKIDPKKYDYASIEQLVQWRVDNATGGGLMVELGSHQLDAAGIFLGHKRPTAVVGTGVTSFLKWDTFDHVFLNYEYGADEPHAENADEPKCSTDNAVVTYSSISTNGFDGYGEQVNGSKATMIIDREADAYLFREGSPKDTRINWAEARVSKPSAGSGSTTQWATGVGTADTITSRGYREEQEHMAWLIRNIKRPDGTHKPRCDGEVALADAIIALTSNIAMAKKQRIEFKDAWFDYTKDESPEAEFDV